MSTTRKVICCVACLLLDGLCLAAKGFEMDVQGFLLLVLSNYLLYIVFAKVGRSRRRTHR